MNLAEGEVSHPPMMGIVYRVIQNDPEKKFHIQLHIEILKYFGAFLGPYMGTIDNLSNFLVDICFLLSLLKLWKIAQTSPK